MRNYNQYTTRGLTACRENNKDTATADAILQSLVKRPNVRSTLILSRKDGSIIKATGFAASDKEEQSRHNRGYSVTEAATVASSLETNGQVAQDERSDSKATGPILSPAQVLAESICTFVVSAAALAESLGKIDTLGNDASTALADSSRGRQEKDDPSPPSTASQADDDIQLLRLRLKKQEVIIFPDPKYLCCVVQDMEKSTR